MKPAGQRTLAQELRTAGARLIVPFVLIGGVVLLIGLFLTRVLDKSGVAEWDVWATRWLSSNRTETGITVSEWGTLLGETPVVVALTAVAAAVFRYVYGRWRDAVLLVLCVVAQSLVFLVVSITIDRPRPRVERLDDSPPTSSFPSGHTAASTALYAGVALVIAWHTRETWLRWLIVIVGLAFPITVATCRMYRGMHYPTDVSMSLLLGLSLLAVAYVLFPLSADDRQGSSARLRRRVPIGR